MGDGCSLKNRLRPQGVPLGGHLSYAVGLRFSVLHARCHRLRSPEQNYATLTCAADGARVISGMFDALAFFFHEHRGGLEVCIPCFGAFAHDSSTHVPSFGRGGRRPAGRRRAQRKRAMLALLGARRSGGQRAGGGTAWAESGRQWAAFLSMQKLGQQIRRAASISDPLNCP